MENIENKGQLDNNILQQQTVCQSAVKNDRNCIKSFATPSLNLTSLIAAIHEFADRLNS